MAFKRALNKSRVSEHDDASDAQAKLSSHKSTKSKKKTDNRLVLPKKTSYMKALQAGGALAITASLAAGFIPLFSSDDNMNETSAAANSTVKFDSNTTKTQVDAMMKYMTDDEIIDAMTTHDKICQLFVVYPEQINNGTDSDSGTATSLNSTGVAKLKEYPFGGVCYFTKNLSSTSSACLSYTNALQNANKYPMLIATDEEGGIVQRIGGYSPRINLPNPTDSLTPSPNSGEGYLSASAACLSDATALKNMYFYESQGTTVAHDNAVLLANNCKLIGVNWDYAPVADIDSYKGNLVATQGRTYSKDATLGSQLVGSAVLGFKDANVASSLKHFPGHGAAYGDTHNGPVPIMCTFEALKQNDLRVFKAGVDNGADSIMLGHLSSDYDEKIVPLSEKWMSYIRSEEGMNFDGVIVTDGMKMGGLTYVYNPSSKSGDAWNGSITAENTNNGSYTTPIAYKPYGTSYYQYSKPYSGYVTATLDYFNAGGDMFLLCGEPYSAVAAFETEIAAGNISEDRIDQSLKRVLKMKRKYIDGYALVNPDAEATYIGSDGVTMNRGSLAEMWNLATTDSLGGSREPVIKLNKDVIASASGSFGNGTNIAANGDLCLPNGKKLVLDLNGHTLNKNLTEDSSGKHLFNITAGSETKLTIQDSSDEQNGKIIGCAGGEGTVAYVTGNQGKFIIDSGTITSNTGDSLIYGAPSTIFRFGVHTNETNSNHAGLVSIEGNTVTKAVNAFGTIYLLGDTKIRNNGGNNLYLDGNAKITIQSEGLKGGNASIGISVSPSRAADLIVATKTTNGTDPLTPTTLAQDSASLFYDTNQYMLEARTSDNAIALLAADGDVRFVSDDGLSADAGTWKEMFALASERPGTLTFLRDTEIDADSVYDFTKNTTINLNGKHVKVNTSKKYFIGVNNSATVTFEDSHSAYISSEKVSAGSGSLSSWDSNEQKLTYYEDVFIDNVLETYRKTADLYSVGSLSMNNSDPEQDPDGILRVTKDGNGKFVINGGRFGESNSRFMAVEGKGSAVINNGYFLGFDSQKYGVIWTFRNGSSITVNGGVFASNTTNDTGESSGIISAANWASSSATPPQINITGGVFSGNSTSGNGTVIGLCKAYLTTKATVSGGTMCYNQSSSTGGAIYANSNNQTLISGALISNNTAEMGGGIYMNGTSSVSMLGGTVVTENKAAQAGGGVYNATSNKLSLSGNVIVKNNNLKDSESASDIDVVTAGNKVVVAGEITAPVGSIGLKIPNAAVGLVVAQGNGYTLSETDASKFFIDDVPILAPSKSQNNLVLIEGEAKYISLDGESAQVGKFKELWEEYFEAGQSGQIILMKDVDITESGTSPSLLSSAPDATLNLNGNILHIQNGNNSSKPAGIKVTGGTLTILDANNGIKTRSKTSDNTAGQLATWNEATKRLTYYTTEHQPYGIETFKNVEDLSNVGAITYSSNYPDSSNTTGAIEVAGGKLILDGGRITATNARGISMAQDTASNMIMSNGYIVGNNSAIGGAVLMLSSPGSFNMTGGVIAANNGSNGGAIWASRANQNVNINGGIISGNHASGQGGAIFTGNYTASVNVSGGMISHNKSEGVGGAISFGKVASDASTSLVVDNVYGDTTISGNKAEGDGGAIYTMYSGRVSLANAHIDANETRYQGGGVKASTIQADSLCVQDNKAAESGGLCPTVSISIRGDMNITGNTANDGASDLDLTQVSAENAQISGALSQNSMIGLRMLASESRSKQIMTSYSSTETYNSIFFDDKYEHHTLSFDNGVYLINEDIVGDDLGHTEPINKTVEIGNSGTGRKIVVKENGTTILNLGTSQLYSGSPYYVVKESKDADGDYQIYVYAKSVTLEELQEKLIGAKVVSNTPIGNTSTSANYNPYGKYIKDIYLAGDIYQGYTKYYVSFTDVSPVQLVSYTIHFLYHHPPSIILTNDYYTEDTIRRVTKTGNIGELVYVPYEDIDGYFVKDERNAISKTLVANAKSGENWYYDESVTTQLGANDSVNDLYVIYEIPKVDESVKYDVNYYDADSNELLSTERLTSDSRDISVTDGMKNASERYYYVDLPGATVDHLSESDFLDYSEDDPPALKLYYRRNPIVTVQYLDFDDRTTQVKQANISRDIKPGGTYSVPNSEKSLDGFDYMESDPQNGKVEVTTDGATVKLYFQRIIYRDVHIDYYDRTSPEQLVGTIIKKNVKAGNLVVLDENTEEEFIIGSSGNRVKYRLNDSDDRNVLSGIVPRVGEELHLSVYCDAVTQVQVVINRYKYENGRWVRLGIKQAVDADENTIFDILTAENKITYADVSGFLLLINDPRTVTSVQVGTLDDEKTPVLNLYYARTLAESSGVIPVQKTPRGNDIEVLSRPKTNDRINVTLYDYGNKIDEKPLTQYNQSTSAQITYPIFKLTPKSENGNFGELISSDIDLAYGDGTTLWGSGSRKKGMNALACSGLNGDAGWLNAGLNGLSYSSTSRTTKTSNPLNYNLSNAFPQLITGAVLDYMFSDDSEMNSDNVITENDIEARNFATRKIADHIDGLFDYDSESGYYYYSSYQNHAQYNEETNRFDIYDAIITPDVADYTFGNFLPLSDIVDEATQVKKISGSYFKEMQEYCQYKYEENKIKNPSLASRYATCAIAMGDYFTAHPTATLDSFIQDYYTTKDSAHANPLPKNVTQPQNVFQDPIPLDSDDKMMYSSKDEFYSKLYQHDYDERTNYLFGMKIEMDFIMPQDATIKVTKGNTITTTPMIFDFEGDDDVLIYIDDILFLNLAGMHHQIGGTIDFAEGKVWYRDFNTANGATHIASYANDSSFKHLSEGYVTFEEILSKAGSDTSVLNDNGTFADWSNHTFKMFYTERGAGSCTLQMKFNIPATTPNSMLIAKNVDSNGVDDTTQILTNPTFYFQAIATDAQGNEKKDPITKEPELYLKPGDTYKVYESGKYICDKIVDENGFIVLKDRQYAIASLPENQTGSYMIRELLDNKTAEQYNSVIALNNVDLLSDNADPKTTEYQKDASQAMVSYQDESGRMVDYRVCDGRPVKIMAGKMSTTTFTNVIDSDKLGSIGIYKKMIDGEEPWERADGSQETFKFAVSFDNEPLKTTANGAPVYYQKYEANVDEETGEVSFGRRITEGQDDQRGFLVKTGGIIELHENEIAVLRYMLANSDFEVIEVSDDTSGSYHPIYENVEGTYSPYAGTIEPGTCSDDTLVISKTIQNQKAKNLIIEKEVTNYDVDEKFRFQLDVTCDNPNVDDVYRYCVVPIDADVPDNLSELPAMENVIQFYDESSENHKDIYASDVANPVIEGITILETGYVEFEDQSMVSAIEIPANAKVIIYGLPFSGNYEVSERDTEGEYAVSNKNETSEDSEENKSSSTGIFSFDEETSSTVIHFTNTKVEPLAIEKKVSIDDPAGVLFGQYDSYLSELFDFEISSAMYQGELIEGEYTAIVEPAYDGTESEEITVAFSQGTTIEPVQLHNNQKITFVDLPYGVVLDVSESNYTAYKTYLSVSKSEIKSLDKTLSTTINDIALNEDVSIVFENELIFNTLPTTGGIGLIVAALALIGGGIVVKSRSTKKKKKYSTTLDK